jgi:hypothetical protein
MPDSFSTQQNCIVEFKIVPAGTFSGVQVNVEFITHSLFSGKNLLKEIVDWEIVVFFIDHVKTNNQLVLIILLSFNSIKHFLNVWFAKEF